MSDPNIKWFARAGAGVPWEPVTEDFAEHLRNTTTAQTHRVDLSDIRPRLSTKECNLVRSLMNRVGVPYPVAVSLFNQSLDQVISDMCAGVKTILDAHERDSRSLVAVDCSDGHQYRVPPAVREELASLRNRAVSAEAEARIAELVASVRQFEEAFAAKRREHATAEERIHDLRLMYEAAVEKGKVADEQIRNLKEVRGSYERQLQIARKERDDSRTHLESVQISNTRLRNETEELKAQGERALRTLGEMRKERDSLAAQLQNEVGRHASTKDELNEYSRQLAASGQRLAASQDSGDVLARALNEACTQRDAANRNLARMNEDLIAARNAAGNSAGALAEALAQRDSIKGEFTRLADQLSGFESVTKQLREQLAKAREDRDYFSGLNQNQANHIRELQATRDDLSQKHSNQASTIRSLQNTIASIGSQGTLVERRVEQHAGDLKHIESTIIRTAEGEPIVKVTTGVSAAPADPYPFGCVVRPLTVMESAHPQAGSGKFVMTVFGAADENVAAELRNQTSRAHELAQKIDEYREARQDYDQLVATLSVALNGPNAKTATLAELVDQILKLKPVKLPEGATVADIMACAQAIGQSPTLLRENLVSLLRKHDERRAAAILRNTLATMQSDDEELEDAKETLRYVRKFEPFTLGAQSIIGNGHCLNLHPAAMIDAKRFIDDINQIIKFDSLVGFEKEAISAEKQRNHRRGREAVKLLRGLLHGWNLRNGHLTLHSSHRKEIAKIVEGK
ncbi:eukaryotic chromosome segregation ATPase-like protein [Burkholderia phage BcepF1]|uniref:Eukaryotic chromosome segregation ATPase-like protein n=1 Tax=Burkholderia phage BcepF1 TaxID=2886897 RepID=A1YZW8_9CAUD|nr:eukaryotic chromosome segregation ATPase-like protein [Burkholderia phage BcepF1]ABL96795.1 eukaryotic chromosome segregation ATPase-like protein [Burkholderia phage BcepF1]